MAPGFRPTRKRAPDEVVSPTVIVFPRVRSAPRAHTSTGGGQVRSSAPQPLPGPPDHFRGGLTAQAGHADRHRAADSGGAGVGRTTVHGCACASPRSAGPPFPHPSPTRRLCPSEPGGVPHGRGEGRSGRTGCGTAVRPRLTVRAGRPRAAAAHRPARALLQGSVPRESPAVRLTGPGVSECGVPSTKKRTDGARAKKRASRRPAPVRPRGEHADVRPAQPAARAGPQGQGLPACSAHASRSSARTSASTPASALDRGHPTLSRTHPGEP